MSPGDRRDVRLSMTARSRRVFCARRPRTNQISSIFVRPAPEQARGAAFRRASTTRKSASPVEHPPTSHWRISRDFPRDRVGFFFHLLSPDWKPMAEKSIPVMIRAARVVTEHASSLSCNLPPVRTRQSPARASPGSTRTTMVREGYGTSGDNGATVGANALKGDRAEVLPLLARDHNLSSVPGSDVENGPRASDAGSGNDGRAPKNARGRGALHGEVLLATKTVQKKKPYKSLGWSLIAVRPAPDPSPTPRKKKKSETPPASLGNPRARRPRFGNPAARHPTSRTAPDIPNIPEPPLDHPKTPHPRRSSTRPRRLPPRASSWRAWWPPPSRRSAPSAPGARSTAKPPS